MTKLPSFVNQRDMYYNHSSFSPMAQVSGQPSKGAHMLLILDLHVGFEQNSSGFHEVESGFVSPLKAVPLLWTQLKIHWPGKGPQCLTSPGMGLTTVLYSHFPALLLSQ